MEIFGFTLGVIALCAVLAVLAYLDRIYCDLDRVTTGRLHEHLDIFEAEIEPRMGLRRRQVALSFSILSHLVLAFVAVETARGVLVFVPGVTEAFAQLVVYVMVEVLLFVQFVPELLLARTTGRWLKPLVPALRFSLLAVWPLRAALELAISVAHISEEEHPSGAQSEQEGIEALVEAAQEEGILAGDEAHLIEQMVEFGDKRVLELMTPRPDIVAIPANSTLDQMRRLWSEAKFSRVLVYEDTLDDVVGIARAQDLLQVSESDMKRRTVRELTHPALFVPETKLGSELLKEMQRRNEHMAVAVDEHGLVAGLVTVEDLVEEIVGELGNGDGRRAPDVVREPDGSVILRGSVSVDKIQELFGIEFTEDAVETATTVAGLLNSVTGHVPRSGEQIDYDGLHFEVVEANQRKVLRLRVRRRVAAVPAP
jgi:putative hemolysin